jgi:HEAT repeat protein
MDEHMRPLRVIRCLPLSLAVVSLLAGVASGQYNRSHLRQHGATEKGAAIDEFAKQLASTDPDVRLQAVKSLGGSKDSKAVEYLMKALADSDVRVQAKAIQMLGDMRAVEATPVLVEYLFRQTTDANMDQPILVALGEIGDPRAAQPVMQFLQRNANVATRGTAIFALGEIGAPESLATLQHIAETDADPTLRRLATEAQRKVEGHQSGIHSQEELSGPLLKPQPTP